MAHDWRKGIAASVLALAAGTGLAAEAAAAGFPNLPECPTTPLPPSSIGLASQEAIECIADIQPPSRTKGRHNK